MEICHALYGLFAKKSVSLKQRDAQKVVLQSNKMTPCQSSYEQAQSAKKGVQIYLFLICIYVSQLMSLVPQKEIICHFL